VDFTAIGMNTVAGLMAQRPAAAAGGGRTAAPGRATPIIPTLAEAGGPPVEMHPWAALVAVAGTPAPVLAQLQRDIAARWLAPTCARAPKQAGFEITPSTPQALRERIDRRRRAVPPLVAEGRVARF
jgi:tripartite-type tricarboxylate transporter receptor subunit TctC